MKIAEINMIATGSTGNIMLNIAKSARLRGHEVKTFSTHVFSKKFKKLPKAPEGHEYYGCFLDNAVHFVLSNFLGKNGMHSKLSTRDLIKRLKKFKPDILHLHNLHDYCINFPMLIKYIKESGVSVFMTLHDCWTFTGHCPHFNMCGCEKWTTGCHNCSQLLSYPKEKRDTSKFMYEKKKEWFSSIDDLTLITPSQWLKGQVEKSFLNGKEIFVINNGINLSTFNPIASNFRLEHNLENKKIVLCVADYWGEKKGLDVVIDVANKLSDDYAVVMVGTDESAEALLPEKVIKIRHTQNQTELAKIYSSADVLVNPTREDNFPTVNMESLACGTPVVTFNTGGSPETIDEKSGIVVPKNDVNSMIDAVKKVCEKKPFDKKDCIARAKLFDREIKFAEYVSLYEEKIK